MLNAMCKLLGLACAALLAAAPITAQTRPPIHWQQGSTIKIPDLIRYVMTTPRNDRIVSHTYNNSFALHKMPFNGQWFCKIDGRNADMIVTTEVFLRNASCSDQAQFRNCRWGSAESQMIIQFKDRGRANDMSAPWVPMRFVAHKYHLGSSNSTILEMRHPDGNVWELHVDRSRGSSFGQKSIPLQGNANDTLFLWTELTGNTVWQNRKFPLTCSRVSP